LFGQITIVEKFGDEHYEIRTKNTVEGREIYEDMGFKTTDSEIRNPDGSIVFSAKNIEIPEAWSQVAADVLAQKYFRKAGVPKILQKVHEEGVPVFLQRSVEDKDALEKLDPDQRYSSETTATQVFDRLAGCLGILGLERKLLRQRR